jgi:hypothetical protein
MRIGEWGEFHTYPPLTSAVVAGAAAGDLTVAGIKVGDTLISVQRIDAAGANLVDEFTITAADTINNAGGTSTATQTVLVMWYSAQEGLAGS